MKSLATILLALVSVSTFAQLPGVDLSRATFSGYNRNLSMSVSLGYAGARLISGTNNRIRPSAALSSVPEAYAGPDPWVEYNVRSFEIFVGESIARFGTDKAGIEKVVNFSSTYFPDGSEIDLKVKVRFWMKDATGKEAAQDVEVQIPVKVYNRGAVFGIYEFENHPNGAWHGVPTVANALRAMQHTVVDRADSAWAKTNLLSELGQCTVFYLNSHGYANPTFLEVQDPYPGRVDVNPEDIWTSRFHAWQNGLPPINLAFLDACSTASDGAGGENHAFSQSFLFPIGNGTQDSVGVGRAQVGWFVEGWTNWVKPFNEAFWKALLMGETVHEARDLGVQALGLKPREGQPEVVEEEYVAVYGDYYAKLWTAYNGLDDNCGWFYIQGLEPGGLE